MTGAFRDVPEERAAAARDRAAALSAAASAIARHVPDMRGLIANLEKGGGSARLVKTLRAWIGERQPVSDVAGVARPNPLVWSQAVDKVIGGAK